MCSKIYVEDINVVKMFIAEWLECLDGLEKEIVKLELRTEDCELLDNTFRYAHRLKGGSSFVGLSNITRLSRVIESIIEGVKDRKVTVNTELIDSLLLSVDFLKEYITGLNEQLNEHNLINLPDETSAKYLEIEHGKKEEPVLESLKLTCIKCQVMDNKAPLPLEQVSEEEIGFEILQSEEFKRRLAEGIKEQFLLENSEHIERIENDLLIRLDSNSDDREAIIEIFRAVHSVKGGTGIYLAALPPKSNVHEGLKKFSEVVHTFEDLLVLIRDKGSKFEKNLVDLGFIVMDYLRSLMNSVALEEFRDLTDHGILDKIKQQASRIKVQSSSSEQPISAMTPQGAVSSGDMKSKGSVTQSIRVNQEKLDKMMNTISELLIAKNSFMHISEKLNLEYDLPGMAKEVKQVGAYVNRISDELQNAIMAIRMVEVKTLFQKMPRLIRDIAQSTGKKMELHMEGENTEIDKTIIEQISDPLVHLIRNAADHGVESLEERLLKGKPEFGRIVLRAYNKNKYVFIEIEDDGKGIDAEKLKKKAIEKGIISEYEAEKMSHKQSMNLIFFPGFSMAKQITEVSGRGVGMDIVKSNISKINGHISIESEVDRGTKMIIQLPLTLAVSRGLIVEVFGETYIFPLESIVETVKINRDNLHKYNGKFFTYLRGEAIGIEWLCKIFLMGERDTENEEISAVILSNGVEKYAIAVDKLRNEQEFVVKTLEGHLAAIPGISGSTLLGNGKVVLIINPVDILQFAEK